MRDLLSRRSHEGRPSSDPYLEKKKRKEKKSLDHPLNSGAKLNMAARYDTVIPNLTCLSFSPNGEEIGVEIGMQ